VTRYQTVSLWPGYETRYSIERELVSRRTRFQQLEICDTRTFGRALFLDDKIQSAESDEHIYHETLVHPALIAHPAPRSVYIAGGGEGATLREALRHPSVERAVMVDIDGEAIDFVKEHMVAWHQGAFDDPRTELVIGDARERLARREETFDAIVVDVTDPVAGGPSYLLFTEEFYRLAAARLKPGGLLSVQAESMAMPLIAGHAAVVRTLGRVFPVVSGLAATTADRAAAVETPYLLIDLDEVVARYRAMRAGLPVERLHYAVKANPHPAIIETLAREGCGFEISSPGELRRLIEAGVAPSRIVSSNPVKTPTFIALAHDYGLTRFAADSESELDKLTAGAPGARVYCRVEVDNSGSMWPLARKFGCKPAEALRLLEAARQRGLRPDGLTFHVGSQCLSAASWRLALERCAEIWRAAAQRGIALEQLDIGGGFPVEHLQPVPDLELIGAVVRTAIEELFPPDLTVSAEPGRGLVGSAGTLVASVIGKAERGEERWLYLDVGVFNGLMETIEQFRYRLRVERLGAPRRWTIAGPSCDSVDVLWTDALLPEMEVGDRVELVNAGAYTLSYASSFNGFPPPQVCVRGGRGR